MERKEQPLFETTTQEGTHVEVAATIPVPKSGDDLLQKAKSAIAEGSLPSNEQMEKNLADAQKTLEDQIKSGNLDAQGKLLAKDAEDIIKVASKALREKNKDEKVQRFFEDTRQAVQENQPIVEKNAEIVKEKGQKIGEKIKGEAKSEKSKIQNKGQNVTEDVQKEGEKIKEKGEKNVDKIKEKGEKLGDKIKEKGEKLGKEAKEMAKDVQPQAEKLQDDAQELLTTLKNFFWNFIKSNDFRTLIAEWVSFLQHLGTKKIKEGAEKLEQSDKTGDAVTNIAKGVKQGLQQTKSKKGQEELQQKTEDKFYELLGKIRSKPEYQQAFRDLFKLLDIATEKLEAFAEDVVEESKEIVEDVKEDTKEVAEDVKEDTKEIAEDVQEKGKKIAKEVKKDAKEISKDVQKKGEKVAKDVKKEVKRTNFESLKTDSFWKAIYDARDILGEFTGQEELDQFVDTLWETYYSVRDDADLNRWFWDFRNFVSELLEDVKEKGPEVLEDAKQQGKRIAKDVKEEAEEKTEEVKQKGKKLSQRAKKRAEHEKKDFDAGVKDAEDVKNSVKAKGQDLAKEAKEDVSEVAEDVKQKGQEVVEDVKTQAKRISEKALPEDRRNEARALFTRGRKILKKGKWNKQFDKLSKEFNVLLDNIKNDSTTNEFGEKIKKLAQDFALNRQGRPDLYVLEDSIIQMKNLLIPLVKDQLAHIKIGKVEFHNETYDVKIEDIGFSGSFLPEHIDLHLRNDSHLDTGDSSKDMMRNILSLSVTNIKPEFRNFKFYYRRKTFPKIEDWGVADLKLSGDGAGIYVTWAILAKGGESPVARLTEVKCTIDKLDWNISGKETHHDVLDKMLLPFVSGSIKNKVAGSIEDLLRFKLGEANARVNEFFQSKPIEALKEKTNETLQQQFKKFQEVAKSVNVI